MEFSESRTPISIPVKTSSIVCSCFHTLKPILYLCTDQYLFSVDLVAGAIEGRVGIAQYGKIQQLNHSASHDLICGVFDAGILTTWDCSTLSSTFVITPEREDEKRPFVSCVFSKIDPYVFIASANTRHINVIDLVNRSSFKLRGNNKKAVVALATHPTQPILAAVSSDGEIKLWDYQSQVIISSVDSTPAIIPQSPRYFVSFDGIGKSLIISTPSGHFCAWGEIQKPNTAAAAATTATTNDSISNSETDSGLSFIGSSIVPSLASGFETMIIHPQISSPPIIFTVDKNGTISSWDLIKPDQPKQSILRPSLRLPPQFSFNSLASQHISSLPLCARLASIDQSNASSVSSSPQLLIHPVKNIITCIPFSAFLLGNTSRIITLEISPRSTTLTDSVASISYPGVESIVWGGENSNKDFSLDQQSMLFLGSHNDIWSHNLSSGKSSLLIDQITPPPNTFSHAESISCSYKNGLAVIEFHSNSTADNCLTSHLVFIKGIFGGSNSTAWQSKKIISGKDALFVGEKDEELVMLSNNGTSIEIGLTESTPEVPMTSFPMPEGITLEKVFQGIAPKSIVVFVKGTKETSPRLFVAFRSKSFNLESNLCLSLLPNEEAIQLLWQRDDTTTIGALLTSKGRILFVTPLLSIIKVIDLSTTTSTQNSIHSIFWAGWALLFSTDKHIKSAFLDGSIVCLLSLNTRPSVICGILPDRILLCTSSINKRILYSRPISMLDPIATGELTISNLNQNNNKRSLQELSERMKHLISRFEWQRISCSLIDKLANAGLNDLSLAFAYHGAAISPNQSTQIDSSLSLGLFDRAIGAVYEESLHLSSQNITNNKQQPLKCRIRSLALNAVMAGQPEIARKYLEQCGDTAALLLHSVLVSGNAQSVASIHPNPSFADSPTLTSISKFLASQKLKPLTLAHSQQSQHPSTKISVVTQASRAIANVSVQKIPRMLWVDNPRHWFPSSSLDENCTTTANQQQQQQQQQQPIIRQLQTPPPTETTESVIHLIPIIPIPSILDTSSSPSKESDLEYSITTSSIIDSNLATVNESGINSTMSVFDAEIEPDLPPVVHSTKKEPTIFRAPPYNIKDVSPAPEAPPPRPPKETPPPPSQQQQQRPTSPVSNKPTNPPPTPPTTSNTITASSPITETRNNGWSRAAASPKLTRTTSVIRTEMTAASMARSKQISSNSIDDVLSTQEYKEARILLSQQWNQRQYDLCLKTITLCLKMASTRISVKADDATLLKEIRQVVAYRIAVALLKEIIVLSSDPTKVSEVALLTKFLADLPLLAQHRLDCIRLAIDKNMAAKNFGITARLIQVLLPHNLPDSKEQNEKFKICKSHKWSDNQLPQYLCPACNQKLSPAASECQCGTPVKFCSIGFKLLEGPSVCKCSVCESPFNTSSIQVNGKCPLCEMGHIEEINLAEMYKKATALQPSTQQQKEQKEKGNKEQTTKSSSTNTTTPSTTTNTTANDNNNPTNKQTKAEPTVEQQAKNDLQLQGATDDVDQEETQ